MPKSGDVDIGATRLSGHRPKASLNLVTRLAHTLPNAVLTTPIETSEGSNTEIALGFGGNSSTADANKTAAHRSADQRALRPCAGSLRGLRFRTP